MVLATFALTRGARSSTSGQAVAVAAPRAVPLAKVSRARHHPATVSRASLGHRPVVVVFGDSVPELLRPSLLAAARRDDARLIDAAVPGCGVAAMTQTDAFGNVVSWQGKCDATAYPEQRSVIARYKPDIVIWWSGTENEPMLLDGTSYPPGTPEHRRALRRAIVAAHQRLTADGARLYLLKVPPHGPPPGGCGSGIENPQCAIDATFNGTIPYVNAQLDWLASRYADTRVISLDRLICPDGAPCPTTIHGVPVRPDGTHFSDAFAPRVAAMALAATGLRAR
jgi:hypothetical protein